MDQLLINSFFPNLSDIGSTATDHTPAPSNTPLPHVPDAHRHFDKQQDDSINDTIGHDDQHFGLLTRANQTNTSTSVPPPRPPSLSPPPIDITPPERSEETRAVDRTEKEEAEGSGMNEGNIRPELSIRGELLIASLVVVVGLGSPSSFIPGSGLDALLLNLVLYSLGLGSGGRWPGCVLASSQAAAITAVQG